MNWLDQLVSEIAAIAAVQKIYLFGSRARGDKEDRSDYDLAVDALGLSAQEWFDITECVEKAETLYKIDVVHIQKAPAQLRENILEDGKILYEQTASNGP